MNTLDLLLSHKSIRKFTDQKIDPDLLNTIFRAGQSAASVQAYSVVRVTDVSLREELSRLCGNQPYVKTCAEFLVCCADLARNKTMCASETDTLEHDPSYMEQLIIGTVDTALMAQNMVVAAESSGLGICYIGGIRDDIESVSRLLELPDFVYPVFGLCLGYPAQNPEPKPRLPQSIWVMENSYQASKKEDVADYDQCVSEYYKTRTSNKKQSTWTEELRGHFTSKVRPHMLEFLRSKGFALK
jgi:nitroreductase